MLQIQENKTVIIGICDDESVFREQIRKLLVKHLEGTGVDYELLEYSSGEELLEQQRIPDFLFMDIEMGKIDGLELKERLSIDEDVKIVFASSHMDAVRDAFGRNVYGFLYKPIEEDRFVKYLERMVMDLEDDEVYLFEGLEEKIAVRMKDILYIHSERKYSRIVTKNEEIFCSESMKELEERLPNSTFYRPHRSYLINFFNVRKARNPIVMINGDKLPVGRRKLEEMREAYYEYAYRKAR